MPTWEDVQHDILLIIVAGLFILFAIGLGAPTSVSGQPVVFPPG